MKGKFYSKQHYFEEYRIKELFAKLYLAESLLNEITLSNSDGKFTVFKENFIDEFYEAEGSNVADFTQLWSWFKPTAEWNIFTGDKGLKLGKEIFEIVDKWKQDQ
ncbi:hypothetical protein [Chryseobacterium geocarposphaerae]|uniref:Uncharacterized protein n=1 Tax=Chryseobacterium geocarposphaerae TaxID=1416776 RepID=A0A2M9CA93_9FLAO|nr:hypothetical protein [Chryseobacterium geocarposphaerae]PJJ67773.1 hypothetical protein CLV73_1792 [Chryseobacterium geocarposphaerae]